jgi:hypothetical protein
MRRAGVDRSSAAPGLRRPRLRLTCAGVRDCHVGIWVDALLLVTRGAVLIAGHSHQDKHEYQPERPADKTKHDPAKAHLPPRRLTAKCEFWHRRSRCRLAEDQATGFSPFAGRGTADPQVRWASIASQDLFFERGTSNSAMTGAVGLIVVDVEVAGATRISFYDVADSLIFPGDALISGNQGLSFLGATVTGGAISRVRITSGPNAMVSKGVLGNPNDDGVVRAPDAKQPGLPPAIYAARLAARAVTDTARSSTPNPKAACCQDTDNVEPTTTFPLASAFGRR